VFQNVEIAKNMPPSWASAVSTLGETEVIGTSPSFDATSNGGPS
jgi:hypothetical protein